MSLVWYKLEAVMSLAAYKVKAGMSLVEYKVWTECHWLGIR